MYFSEKLIIRCSIIFRHHNHRPLHHHRHRHRHHHRQRRRRRRRHRHRHRHRHHHHHRRPFHHRHRSHHRQVVCFITQRHSESDFENNETLVQKPLNRWA